MVGQKTMWEVIDGCDDPAQVEIIPNRKAAIELAVRDAEAGDHIVLVEWVLKLGPHQQRN